MKKAIMSSSKHCEHSNKDCCCGGHNASNAKSNLHHNGTKKKYLVRLTQKLLKKMRIKP